ncbi:hypothetical protein AJ80_04831 [Polytolypa hystricis UAMH7299]|uniref:RING-type domain-containing protein n=1 Tax=Polytolypa hystricis (strain UAMH7299) TaxID=1447883 RepID=A0A2B7Y7B3_POLH7|nr:hypothetical protein AJ80_04831 [Polytolypa hystricis UAMH7299]
MASYEVEHSTTPRDTSADTTTTAATGPSHAPPRRPDLSTFFATLNEIAPNPSETRSRPYALPVPGDVSAAFRSLAEAFNIMRREGGVSAVGEGDFPVHDGTEPDISQEEEGSGGLLTEMIQVLLREAEEPPREVEGVGDEFCDALERVPNQSLKPSQTCPICNNPFLDDPYPLVVRLPCHTTHLFDLECVRPWLRLRGTCPLDRVDFGAKEREKEKERLERMLKRGQVRAGEDEEDEEWDGMYG